MPRFLMWKMRLGFGQMYSKIMVMLKIGDALTEKKLT